MHAAAEQRLEELVNRYGRLITAAVSRVGGARVSHMRADIEQEVLLALWRQVRSENVIEHPPSYLYRAAVRETVRVLNREAGRGETALEDPEAPAAVDERDPERVAESSETLRAIEAALSELSPDRRLAARAHLAGFRVQEIMRMQGWPYQKARNLVARGMGDLRRHLKEAGIDA